MKRLSVLVAFFSLLCVLHAEGPDGQYVGIYNLILQGDTLDKGGQPKSAAEKYIEARDALLQIQKTYPNWSEKVVQYRLNYLKEKLESLESFAPSTNVSTINSVTTLKPLDAAELQKQVQLLSDQVGRLEGDKTSLEAKLKEALAAQPATINPEQLAKAETQIVALQKERDLLKVSLEQQTAAAKTPVTDAAGFNQKIKQLEQDRNELQKNLSAANRQLGALQKEGGKSEKSFDSESKKVKALEQDRDELQKKLSASAERQKELEARLNKKPVAADTSKIRQIEDERDSLRKKLDATTAELAVSKKQQETKIVAVETNLKDRKEVEAARDDTQKKLAAVTKDFATQEAAYQKEIKQLKETQSELEKKLALANKPASQKKFFGKSNNAQKEIEQLRANLAAYDSKAVPFTPEELALFKKPEPQLAEASTFSVTKKKSAEIPKGAGTLAAEAEKAFTSNRFDEAETKYKELLRQDENNVYTLGNLASVQIELNHLSDAETNLQRALKVEPNDGFSLLLLGKLRFTQEKYDEALDALSRAAQINPGNAETQNYLGIVLSEKGQRAPAEAALRKALQLQPNYASAHHNLAVIYATQKPPFLELARWHYEKAISLGHPKNPGLEAVLNAPK